MRPSTQSEPTHCAVVIDNAPPRIRPRARRRVRSTVAGIALVLFGGNAMAITGGDDAPDHAGANASVFVNGASGTLITPRLVITNGHVTQVPLPEATPPFSRTNGHDPAIWHPIDDGGVTVFIGAAVGRVNMTRHSVLTSPRTRFELDDRDRGALLSGDLIGLKTHGHYLFVNGGARGGDLRIDPLFDRWDAWQQLRIHKIGGRSGDPIRGGDRVALRAADGSYLAATRRDGFVLADGMIQARRHEFRILSFDGRGPLAPDPIRHGATIALASTDVRVGYMQAPYRTTGVRIATPGFEDMALVELAEPVPYEVARPMPIKLRLGADEARTVDEFYRDASLSVAGYGLIDGGVRPIWRQQAAIGNAVRETPGSDPIPWTRYIGVGRAGTQPGDSGGSWFIQDRRGRTLVGITQQAGNRFLTPMYRGGLNVQQESKPDVHAWFSMFLDDDDCVPLHEENGIVLQRGRYIGASRVCRFGAAGAPFAVAYPSAPRMPLGEDCVRFNPRTLSLRRPSTPEGMGSDAWTLVDGAHQMLRIEGSWQQSYTRGAYLIDYLQRTGMTRMCFTSRKPAELVYFRP